MAIASYRDRFGYCVKCHTYLLREVIDRGKVILAPTADADSEMLLLDNNTQMRISICTKCKRELQDNDFDYIMNAVVQGWDWETDQLVKDPKKNWKQKDKKEYMDRHKKLKIVAKSNGLSKKQMDDKIKKFKDKDKNKDKD